MTTFFVSRLIYFFNKIKLHTFLLIFHWKTKAIPIKDNKTKINKILSIHKKFLKLENQNIIHL